MVAKLKLWSAKLRALTILSRQQAPTSIADLSPKPHHIAVIMDGNGRWANSKGLTRVAGHKRGVDAVKNLIKNCIKNDIKVLSLFAFSSENWGRPESEVQALMELLTNALDTQTKKLDENGIQLRLLGDLSRFNKKIQELASKAQTATQDNQSLILNVAINYGGRWDILQATKAISAKVVSGEIAADQIDEAVFEQHLATADIPDPDLLIRTSGEYRVSNFLLWQTAYSEFYFSDVLWPDFDEQAFNQALLTYTNRDRRFGGAKDKPSAAKVQESDEQHSRQYAHDEFDEKHSSPDRIAESQTDSAPKEGVKHA